MFFSATLVREIASGRDVSKFGPPLGGQAADRKVKALR